MKYECRYKELTRESWGGKGGGDWRASPHVISEELKYEVEGGEGKRGEGRG